MKDAGDCLRPSLRASTGTIDSSSQEESLLRSSYQWLERWWDLKLGPFCMQSGHPHSKGPSPSFPDPVWDTGFAPQNCAEVVKSQTFCFSKMLPLDFTRRKAWQQDTTGRFGQGRSCGIRRGSGGQVPFAQGWGTRRRPKRYCATANHLPRHVVHDGCCGWWVLGNLTTSGEGGQVPPLPLS